MPGDFSSDFGTDFSSGGGAVPAIMPSPNRAGLGAASTMTAQLATMLLDTQTWDLVLDASGNLAVATPPYSQAQDAASAIKLFLGENWYDTTQGIPYLAEILGQNPSLATLKSLLVGAALTVSGVTAAQVFIASRTNRIVTGQVQITNTSGQTSAAGF
jgi:hypothetical protein